MEITSGLTAFITGGAQGIGLGIARSLARRGVRLALADIDTEALASAVDELSAYTAVDGFALDVRDRDAYRAVADAAEERLGHVSILVNNAGVGGIGALMPITEEIDYGTWDFVVGVNLEGVNNGVTTFLPRMTGRGGPGHIVNTASAAGLAVFPERSSGYTYHASKFAIVGLTEALRRGLRDAGLPIGASVLLPGMVTTGIVTNSMRAAGEAGMRYAASERAAAHVETGNAALARHGHGIGSVGELVAAGISEDRLYLLTDRLAAKALAGRTADLLAAMPAEHADHDDALARTTTEHRTAADQG